MKWIEATFCLRSNNFCANDFTDIFEFLFASEPTFNTNANGIRLNRKKEKEMRWRELENSMRLSMSIDRRFNRLNVIYAKSVLLGSLALLRCIVQIAYIEMNISHGNWSESVSDRNHCFWWRHCLTQFLDKLIPYFMVGRSYCCCYCYCCYYCCCDWWRPIPNNNAINLCGQLYVSCNRWWEGKVWSEQL